MTRINRAIYISTGVGRNRTIAKRKERKSRISRHVDLYECLLFRSL